MLLAGVRRRFPELEPGGEGRGQLSGGARLAGGCPSESAARSLDLVIRKQ